MSIEEDFGDGEFCPKCGAAVFHVVPGKTTEENIREFQAKLVERKGPITFDPGWMHPGAFCTECNWGILAEYAPPELSDEEKAYYQQKVELYYEIGSNSEDRKRRIIALRNYLDDFRKRPMVEIVNELRDRDVHILGVYERGEAEWRLGRASEKGLKFEIKEINES